MEPVQKHQTFENTRKLVQNRLSVEFWVKICVYRIVK